MTIWIMLGLFMVFLVGGALVQRVKPWELDQEWSFKGEDRHSVESIAAHVEKLGLPFEVVVGSLDRPDLTVA